MRSVPAVVIDGQLAAGCAGRGPDEAPWRAAGWGNPCKECVASVFQGWLCTPTRNCSFFGLKWYG